MKKILAFFIILTILLYKIPSVYALDINVKEVTVYDRNDTVSVSNVTSDGSEIIPKITFNNVNDYVTLKISFKGKDIDKYKIKSITDNNKSEYIKTTYSSKEYLSNSIFLVLSYNKASNEDTSINNINILIELVDSNGNEEEIIINNKSNQDVSSSAQTGTLSYILTPVIILIISVFLIAYYTKNSKIGTMIVLLLLIIPITVLASENIKIALTINAKSITIKGTDNTSEQPVEKKEYVVYLYPNGGTGITEGQKFTYTETTSFSKFPKVTKTNCTLEGWSVDSPSGKKYYQNIDSTDNGKKLYASWNCQTNISGIQGTYYAPIQNTTNYKFSPISETGGCSNGEVYHDLLIETGIPIYAGMDGTAEFIQVTGLISGERMLVSYGNQVKITSNDGKIVIIYAHLSKFVSGINTPVTTTCPKKGSNLPCPASSASSLYKNVVNRKTVKKGDLIGYTGDTGNSTAPHLHVEIKENGICACDPYGEFGMRSKKC